MHLMTPRSSKRKAKERQEKAKPVFAPTPGPGEYTPRRQSSTTAKFAGSAAFKSSSSSVSSSARGACYLRDMGDVSALPRALIYLRRFMLALLTSARESQMMTLLQNVLQRQDSMMMSIRNLEDSVTTTGRGKVEKGFIGNPFAA